MPSIAIIGRQNVGKSTLFNAITNTHKSVTFDEPGVTRDIISSNVDWAEGTWTIADFPGFENLNNLKDDTLALLSVQKGLEKLEKYNLLLWVIARTGLTQYEHELFAFLRTLGKPFWLLVNFTDDPTAEIDASDFYSLGIPHTIFISGKNKRNIDLLKNTLIHHFTGTLPKVPKKKRKEKKGDIEETDIDTIEDNSIVSVTSKKTPVRLTIIGKPNAGKSTLFNSLLQKEKALVSPIPGTTRDAIDEEFSYYGQPIVLVDTAGLRKNKSSQDWIERFSVERTKHAILNSDVVIFLMDPFEGFDRQNKIILDLAYKYQKPLVIGINKNDLLKKNPDQKKIIEDQIKDMRTLFWDFPVQYISALEVAKTSKLISLALDIKEQAERSYTTHSLNKIIGKIRNLPVLNSINLRLFYITQGTPLLKFILFSNKATVTPQISRFLMRAMQRELKIEHLPVFIENRLK